MATAKAMAVKDSKMLQVLATWGLLNQDDRQVERKKAGFHKARKKPQFSKR